MVIHSHNQAGVIVPVKQITLTTASAEIFWCMKRETWDTFMLSEEETDVGTWALNYALFFNCLLPMKRKRHLKP